MLDWTRHARIAAYFAACSVKEEDRTPSELAVWALERREPDGSELAMEFCVTPSASNPNLRAQSGLFTMHMFRDGRRELPLEDAIASFNATSNDPIGIIKITLDTQHSRELLYLLADEGVDGASLFPGPDGVVKKLRETPPIDGIL